MSFKDTKKKKKKMLKTQVRFQPSLLLDSNRNSEEGFVGKMFTFFFSSVLVFQVISDFANNVK